MRALTDQEMREMLRAAEEATEPEGPSVEVCTRQLDDVDIDEVINWMASRPFWGWQAEALALAARDISITGQCNFIIPAHEVQDIRYCKIKWGM